MGDIQSRGRQARDSLSLSLRVSLISLITSLARSLPRRDVWFWQQRTTSKSFAPALETMTGPIIYLKCKCSAGMCWDCIMLFAGTVVCVERNKNGGKKVEKSGKRRRRRVCVWGGYRRRRRRRWGGRGGGASSSSAALRSPLTRRNFLERVLIPRRPLKRE